MFSILLSHTFFQRISTFAIVVIGKKDFLHYFLIFIIVGINLVFGRETERLINFIFLLNKGELLIKRNKFYFKWENDEQL